MTPAVIFIDTFDDVQTLSVSAATPTPPVTHAITGTATTILGLQREVQITKNTGVGGRAATFNVAAGSSVAAFSTDIGVGADLRIVYDGTPGGDTIGSYTAPGFTPFNLDNIGTRINLGVEVDPTAVGVGIQLTAFSAGGSASQTQTVMASGSTQVLAYPISGFTGGGFNATAVTGFMIETVGLPLAGDLIFDVIEVETVADLQMTKTVSPTNPNFGDVVTYTLTFNNAGPDAVPTNVVVTDTLPAGLTYITGQALSPSLGSASFASNTITWTMPGTLTSPVPLGSRTLTFQARVTGTGTITNTGTVGIPPGVTDPNPGNNSDGENVNPPAADFGDAPASYGTTIAPGDTVSPNGARHNATNIRLGTGRDTESDGPSSGNGTQDGSDEDGVTISSLGRGATVSIPVNIQNASGGSGFLSAWIDFNGNGDFGDPGEQVANGQSVNNGDFFLSVNVPATAALGSTYARFRVAEVAGQISNPSGSAASGEVEDYPITISEPVDIGVTKSVSGTQQLGQVVTFTVTATNNGPDAASRVTIQDALPSGLTYQGPHTASHGTYTPGTGVWSIGNLAIGETATLTISARIDAAGTLTNTASLDRRGLAPGDNNPTNDSASAQVVVQSVDFGDAPASYGTLLADGGARHLLGTNVATATPRLGTNLDGENNGPSSGNGTQDDTGSDDEDGVSFALLNNTLIVAKDNTITITGTPGALVDAWVDFGDDGTFDSSADRITAAAGTVIPASGALALTVHPAVTSVLGSTYARFRISSVGGLAPTGQASDGEVEDYPVILAEEANLSLDKAITNPATNPVVVDLGDTITFTITVTNQGPASATGVTVTDVVPSGLGSVTKIAGPGGILISNGILTWSGLGTIPANGGSVTLTYTATATGSGTFSNYAQIATVTQYDPNSTPGDNSGRGQSGDPADQDDDDRESFTVRDLDFGDAPTSAQSGFTNSYPTSLAQNGARHVTSGNTLQLGTLRDSENNGQAQATALGDDTGSDDEDAVGSGFTLTQGINNRITIPVQGSGFLSLWLDLNADGDWTDPGEQVLNGVAVVNGANDFDINPGLLASPNVNTFARFRLASNPTEITAPTGLANDGEIEDHAVLLRQEAELQVDKSVDNATPDVGENVVFTVMVTNNGPNPATNVTIQDALPSGLTFVSVSPAGTSYAGGVWTVGTVNPGIANAVSIQITARVDTIVSRTNTASVQTSDQYDPIPGNNSDNASVDAHDTDFGDAPESYGTRLRTPNDAARHRIGSIRMGASVDAENDGPTSGTAVQDDNTGSPDDENGVFQANGTTPFAILTQDVNNTLVINANTGGILNAWFDLNLNGDFDSNEHLINEAPLLNGSNNIIVNPGLLGTINLNTYARFRITTGTGQGNTPTGLALNGEVEDYAVLIRQEADLRLNKTVNNSTPLVGDQITFTVTVTNDGPNAATTVTVHDALPSGLTLISGGFSSATGTYNTSNNIWTIGTIPSGNTVTARFTVLVETDQPRTNEARVETSDQFDPDSTPGNNPGQDDRDPESVTPIPVDMGDAPRSSESGFAGTYPTLVADNGARHGAVAGPILGTTRDTELNGQPNAAANGDGADEDGVQTLTLTIGTTQTISIRTSGAATSYLNAWIDFNHDGDWDDPGEHLLNNRQLVSGLNDPVVFVPLDATPGNTYARYRLTSTPVTTPVPTGSLPDGEVEDYRMLLQRIMDFGDAPDSYGTQLANGAAAGHVTALGTGPYLGTQRPDADPNGQPTTGATGDDSNGTPDDEDGVTFPTLIQGMSVNATVVAPLGGRLDAFIDFNGNGVFDTNERITPVGGTLLAAGSNNIPFTVPGDAFVGTTYARFRISSAGNLGPTDLTTDGEVEDYGINILLNADFGDAPDTYATLLSSNGPRHLLGTGSLRLGATVDRDTDGQPTTFGNPANGDDNNGTPDDEDGVTFSPLARGGNATFTVTASGSGRVDAFLDLNGDGDFTDPGEKVLDNVSVNGGSNALTVPIPMTATLGQTYARVRLSSAGGLSFDGQALDGEVEDYQVNIVPGGRIEGTVYVDANKDGTLQGGEQGLGGVPIQLLDSNGNVVDSTLTGPDGSYVFNVAPGTYTVVETQPRGYGSSTSNQLPPITLGVNQSSTGNNFGETLSSLSGTVYYDQNDSGVQNPGEVGIPGAIVRLTGTDANGQPVDITTATDTTGRYRFDGLLGGTYTVTETQPQGFTDGRDTIDPTTSVGGTPGNEVLGNIPLPSGVDVSGYNFGELGTVVSGTVYHDVNKNGVIDPNEPGLGNVTLSLRNSAGVIVAYAQTAVDGSYLFNLTDLGLPPGQYTIAEIQPSGYGSSTPNSLTVTVPVNGLTNQNFGDTLAQISGRVYLDANRNGQLTAGEQGISGVTITLTGTDVRGQPVNRTTTTAADGTFSFTDLLAANTAGYTLTETQPASFNDGADRAGTINGTVRGTVGTPSTVDRISAIPLGAGQAGINYLFGEVLPAGRTFVSGVVFHDQNGDGVQNPGEPGIPGSTVELRHPTTNALIASLPSDVNGAYRFDNIPTGSYRIVQPSQPTGFPDSTTPNTIGPVTVPAAGLTNRNFGETYGQIRGLVYVDRNNNGVPDVGEQPIPGATVTLSGPVSQTVTTGPDGTYSFSNLPAGSYTLTETQPTGYGDGTDRVGTANGTLGNDVISNINLQRGQTGANYDFGERTGSLSGKVYLDLNNNGTPDANEPGLGGVTVTLTGTTPSGTVNRTATTLPDGTYEFTDLTPGTYTLTETDPGNYDDGTDRIGTAGGTPGNDVASTINLQAGQAGINYDFGERLQAGTGSVLGTVYLDGDRDGTQDPNEPGDPGVVVELLNSVGTVIATTTTGPLGDYLFPNVTPGSGYQVRITTPPGHGNSTPTTVTGLTVVAGNPPAQADFGLTLGKLSGHVYEDGDLSGVRTGSEPGIPGVTVTLTGTDANGQPVNRTAITDENGRYEFDDLLAGSYTVTENQMQPALIKYYDGARFAVNANDQAFIDLNQNGVVDSGETTRLGTRGTNVLSNIVLGAGEAGVEANLGEVPPADPFGFVWLDLNRDGIRDANEPGIPGVQVTLSGTSDLTGQPLAANEINFGIDDNLDGDNNPFTRITDANGRYAYEVLPPGTYSVTQTQPAGYLDGQEDNEEARTGLNPGLPAATVGNDVYTNIVTPAGTIRGPYNFGEIQRASLSGNVYLDANVNGVRDASERFVGGVLVTLSGTDAQGNRVVRTTRTNAAGQYTFADLPASNATGYTLTMTPPAGLLAGRSTSPRGTPSFTRITRVVIAPIDQNVGPFVFSLVPASKRNLIR